MPRALVTGATGFIGGHLCRALRAQGWEVAALTRPGSNPLALPSGLVPLAHDGTTEGLVALMRASRPDIVFHLASRFLADHGPKDVEDLIHSNVLLGAQLLEAMAQTGVSRLVNTGTSWQHFGTQAYRPVNLYAATKEAFEALAAYYHDAAGLACLTLKLYDTYGPGDTRRKLVTILLDAAGAEAPLAMSPGDQVLDLTHVEDVVAAFLVAAERLEAATAPQLETFTVSGERLTVKALVDRVREITDRPLPVTFGGRPYRPREVMVPMAPLPLPGWTPRIPLAEGLAVLAASRA